MVVSKKKLSIDSGKLYATTSKKAIEESSDVFINMMIPMMGMIVGLSVIDLCNCHVFNDQGND